MKFFQRRNSLRTAAVVYYVQTNFGTKRILLNKWECMSFEKKNIYFVIHLVQKHFLPKNVPILDRSQTRVEKEIVINIIFVFLSPGQNETKHG